MRKSRFRTLRIKFGFKLNPFAVKKDTGKALFMLIGLDLIASLRELVPTRYTINICSSTMPVAWDLLIVFDKFLPLGQLI